MEAFSKKLVSSDPSIRDKTFKALTTWLQSRGNDLEYREYMLVWKSLFYCMWMADKKSYQETLAVNLAKIAEVLEGDALVMFLQAFWETIIREWPGIDRYRLDKYYLLLRAVFVQSYRNLPENLHSLSKILSGGPLDTETGKVPMAIQMYLIENFHAALSEALHDDGQGEISKEQVLEILQPFLIFVSKVEKKAVLEACNETFLRIRDLFGPDLDYSEIAKFAFDIGADNDILPRNRKVIYAISSSLKKQ